MAGEWRIVLELYHASAKANRTLSGQQRPDLVDPPNLDGYETAPNCVSSDTARKEPVLKDVDALFFAPGDNAQSDNE